VLSALHAGDCVGHTAPLLQRATKGRDGWHGHRGFFDIWWRLTGARLARRIARHGRSLRLRGGRQVA